MATCTRCPRLVLTRWNRAAGPRVADLRSGGDRRTVLEPRGAHRAAHRLGDDLVCLEVGVPAPAEAFDGGVDDARVDLLQTFPAEAKPIHHPGAEVLHQDVGLSDEVSKDLLPVVALQVQGDAALVAVEHGEVEAVDVGHVAQLGPSDVAASRWLDLDDLGAEPGEHLCR